MYTCLTCGHILTFHKARGDKEPCYLCPPTSCMVAGCTCSKYEGTSLTDRPHLEHLATRLRWGSWGLVGFSVDEEHNFVGGPEPVIEKAGIRFHPDKKQ